MRDTTHAWSGDSNSASLDETEPVELEEVNADSGLEPPDDWDADAHDEEDVREGVQVTMNEEDHGGH